MYRSNQELSEIVWQLIEDNIAYEDLFSSKRLPEILSEELYSTYQISLDPIDVKSIVAASIKEQLLKMGYRL